MVPLTPSALLRTALLLWVAAFFCLVVPLHHRGLVALPGAAAAQSGEAAPYCPLCSVWSDENGDPPPADAPIGCAICHLKSNLELPPTWAPPPTLVGELEFLIPPAVTPTHVALATPARLRGRGPPAA